MIRAAILVAALACPTLAAAQVGCLPPEEPFPYAPPEDDPELRALIDEQYQDDIVGTETYLNCLNTEATRVRDEYQAIMGRYMRFFGSDAGLKFDAPG